MSIAHFIAPASNKTKHSIPPGTDVIEVASRRSDDAIAILFGDLLAVIFNLIRMDGKPFVMYADVCSAALRSYGGKSAWEQARMVEYVRYRIEDSLARGGIGLLGGYTPPDRARRLRLCEQVMDEIAECGWSWSAYRLSTRGY